MSRRNRRSRIDRLERNSTQGKAHDDGPGPVLTCLMNAPERHDASNGRIFHHEAGTGGIGGVLEGIHKYAVECHQPDDGKNLRFVIDEATGGDKNALKLLIEFASQRSGRARASHYTRRAAGRKKAAALLEILKPHTAAIEEAAKELLADMKARRTKRRAKRRFHARLHRERREAEEKYVREREKLDQELKEKEMEEMERRQKDEPPAPKPKKPFEVILGGKAPPPAEHRDLHALNGAGGERVFGGVFEEPDYQPGYFWNAPTKRESDK